MHSARREGSKYGHGRKRASPFVAAFEPPALGPSARQRSQVQAAIAVADAEGQAQEGAGETGQILAHGAAEPRKERLDPPAKRDVKVKSMFHR